MIKTAIVNPRKSLNKSFLKLKPNRTEIESFKKNLIELIDHIDETESEEFHKNLVSNFLTKTYYGTDHFINTKGRNDLVIHTGKDAKTNVGVIIEAKSPTNKTEMLKKDNINNKAFHELILYYLRERITGNNIEVKHLIATNIFEWYIFDARDFDKLFAQNKHLVKQFNDFEEKRLASTDTGFFYKEIAEKFVNLIETEISFTYFDIRDYEKPLRNLDKKDDNVLIALYKLLSPQHLLKQKFLNDSNSLDKTFYSELLHIIGLEETKDGSKKLIGRKASNRHNGTLIENAIIQLDALDKISRLTNPEQYGNTKTDKLYNVSLELVITWINRILFLKLLEAQLVAYHKGDKSYEFLNTGKIKDFDELNSLFFRVLARKPDERSEDVAKLFATVPYLNSSLFEPTELEHQTVFISGLRNESKVPIISNTVLKDNTGKKRCGELNPLEYIFEFLNAYDFSSEGSEEIQEENKTLINASVLGLIFEKINGYKDGSFFTPGFITMYMCRETIRRAVLQKFNQAFPLPGGGEGVGQVSSWKSKVVPYRSDLPDKARNLRNNPTVSEQILWKALKGKNQFGYDFHRQKPIYNFIADFYCRELKLVIELDGASHLSADVIERDKTKEQRFNELGLNLLRFPDALVINDTSNVLKQIEIYINAFIKKDSTLYRDVCTPDLSYKTALNPLSGMEYVFGCFGNLEGVEDTPPDPLSRGGEEEGRYKSMDDLYNAIGKDFTKEEANSIINSLKICDPAVGSGHFLVSALNEIIAIKSELKILCDSNGKSLRDYTIEVVNDELSISDEDGKAFEYNPNNPENRRVQETLFHEKQTIIENCLFGVDINPNSVKICRLRLWIELLKNAYYKAPDFKELETLPNIDINIKCGNSLISRYALDSDIKAALKKSKWTVDSYRLAVMTYRNAQNKEEKREMEKLIGQIKNDFESEVALNDKRVTRLRKLKADLLNLTTQTSLFEKSKTEIAIWNKQLKALTTDIQKLETELEEIKNNKIYENAFEWRFEFPEVLNDEGDFVGFDCVIGNPPYINAMDFKKLIGDKEYVFYKQIYKTAKGTVDAYIYFFELGFSILKSNFFLSLITPNRYLSANYGLALRQYLIKNYKFIRVGDYSNVKVFSEASTYPIVSLFQKFKTSEEYSFKTFTFINETTELFWRDFSSNLLNYFNENILGFLLSSKFDISKKVIDSSINLSNAGIINATSTAGEAEKFHNYINDISSNYKLINTGTIDRYCSTWGLDELLDKGTKYLTPYLPKEKDLLGKNRFELYRRPKIIFAKIALCTEAFYDEEGCYSSINTNCMHSFNSNFHPYFILGWLNSKLFQYTFECFFDGLKMSGGYLLYSAPNLNNMYIKNATTKEQNPIIEIVSKIMTIKNDNPKSDTSALESEIDRLVYELYGLTEEEIKIVEGKIHKLN